MSLKGLFRTGLTVGLWCSVALAAHAQTGRIEGRVVKNGQGVAGVVVLITELKLNDVSDDLGAFSFAAVPEGVYTLLLTQRDNSLVRPQVGVLPGQTRQIEIEIDWEVGVTEKVTVTAAARAAKIVDAPAAVTEIPEEQIERSASTGQVPKLLEFTPGAEVTQSGLYDFNFNTRGFNSSLNRRVSTYIDGRDVGVVLLGAQEWAAIAGGLDDVASLEFVRGPSAALYGANASSGVINITTKAPRDSLGGFVRLTTGQLDTQSVDFRWAGNLGGGWYSKVLGGFKNSGDFTVSRNPDVVDEPEYSEFCMLVGETDCLPTERTLFREQNDDIRYASARFDRYLADGSVFTLEAGGSDIEGPVFQTGIGRVQGIDAQRPFYRLNWSDDHWTVLAHFSEREGDQRNLTKDLRRNFELITDSQRYGVEAQTNWSFLDERLRWVFGAAYTKEDVDSTNPATGLQTVVYEPISSDRQAVFTQLDWKINDLFKLVVAGRVDWSTLHATQFSPKAAFVYSMTDNHSLRLTYNEAFQVANYSEFFLSTRIASFPIGGFVRTICEAPILPMPVDCGIDDDFIPILAVGNDDLELEETQAWEIGYSGLFGRRVFVTLDYYNANNKNFITDLIPQVGTILGNTDGCVDSAGNPETDPTECPVNADYLPWVSTDEAETTILFTDPINGPVSVAQALRNAVDNSVGGNTLGFRLAQNLDGSTVVVGRTYSNVGNVDTQGIDLGVQYFVTDWLSVQLSYSWFDFEIKDNDDPRIEEVLLPNTPEHKGSVSVSFAKKAWTASVAARWVEGFRWAAGVFQGDVEDYETVDLGASYRFNDTVSVGVNVANALDNVHRQTFGGDLLSRRALLNTTFAW